MVSVTYEVFTAEKGTWGPLSHRPGNPIKLNVRKLREQYLLPCTDQSESFYIRMLIDGNLVGNAFACRWKCKSRTNCWISQLVVDRHHRRKGLASILLRALARDSDDIYGIMSSHPAACLAAAKAYGRAIEKVDLEFISKNANEVLLTSPIPYIRNAELCGTIFDVRDTSGMVSGVNTSFFVDHTEPLEALAEVEREWQWPLGM
ncbi:hypothetical protein PENDEC_c023G01060 [Penicillium decumbens]|uniref:N-acetyltransferase domain-containing protein n=1 Tax=Penicillium decumbens TaxID=69771 RepID=A0A1V6P0S6_PENDC|nr:hypothetical protein PENDEC_c023G01060 [Penicillium decumbens]